MKQIGNCGNELKILKHLSEIYRYNLVCFTIKKWKRKKKHEYFYVKVTLSKFEKYFN